MRGRHCFQRETVVSSYCIVNRARKTTKQATDHGCPPHSNLGPRTFFSKDRQFSTFHVCSTSESISRSGVGICMRALMAASYEEVISVEVG